MTRNTIFGIVLTLLLVGFGKCVNNVSAVSNAFPTSTTSWNKTYGGTENDAAYSVIQTGDGGYALAGSTRSYGAGESDFWLVKTDADGNVQWSKTYGGTSVDYANSIVKTGDGGYALAGYTYSFGAGSGDFWLVKTDASGNMQWNKTYGGGGYESCNSIVTTNDGGYALAGFTYSFGAGQNDFWLVKTDASGNMQWSKTYGGTSYDSASSIIRTNDGGFALAGGTDSWPNIAAKTNFWLVKTDVDGNVQWDRAYGDKGYDAASSVIQTSDEGYMLVGTTDSFGSGDYDIWIIKTDASGHHQWNYVDGFGEHDSGYAIVQTSDGGYAIGGSKGIYYDSGFTYSDFWLIKIDASGNLQWDKTYGGTEDEEAFSMVKTGDGGYALAGWKGIYDNNGFMIGDFWLVKTDAYGNGTPSLDLTLIIIIASVIGIVSASTVLILYLRKRARGKTQAQLPLPPPPPPPPPPS